MAGLLVILIMLSATLGCACLALAQSKPWRAVYGKGAPERRNGAVFLYAGYGLLGLSFLFSIVRDALEMAALLWPLALAAGAGGVTLILAYAPWMLKPLGTVLDRVPDVIRAAGKKEPRRE